MNTTLPIRERDNHMACSQEQLSFSPGMDIIKASGIAHVDPRCVIANPTSFPDGSASVKLLYNTVSDASHGVSCTRHTRTSHSAVIWVVARQTWHATRVRSTRAVSTTTTLRHERSYCVGRRLSFVQKVVPAIRRACRREFGYNPVLVG